MRAPASEGEQAQTNQRADCSYKASPAAHSVLRESPAFAALAIAIGCSDNFADPDLWMHILAGLQILHTGHIPLRDVYSYSAAGSPWRDHEWLAQGAIALAYAGLGIAGLRLLKLSCTVVVIVSLAAGLARTAAPLPVQRVLLVAVAVCLAGPMQYRPQMFTFALLSVLIATLAYDTYRSRIRLWPLIPMFAIWANLHGGFMVGLLVLVIYAITRVLQELSPMGEIGRARGAVAVTIGCAAATLLNPLGIQLGPQVLHSVSDPVIRLFDLDWLPLPLAIVSNWREAPLQNLVFTLPVVLFVAFVGSLLTAPVIEDVPIVVIALSLIVTAFYSNRNVALAVISLVIPFAHHLGLSIRSHNQHQAKHNVSNPSPLLIAGTAVLILAAGGIFSNRLKTWEPVPTGALAFMSAHGLKGNILNDFDWGSYLIWHCSPRCRVFIDGRSEVVYPDHVIRDYVDFLNGSPGSARVLDSYPSDLVLVKPATGAFHIVSAAPRWKIIYQDSVSALFSRSPIPGSNPPDPYVTKRLAPSSFP